MIIHDNLYKYNQYEKNDQEFYWNYYEIENYCNNEYCCKSESSIIIVVFSFSSILSILFTNSISFGLSLVYFWRVEICVNRERREEGNIRLYDSFSIISLQYSIILSSSLAANPSSKVNKAWRDTTACKQPRSGVRIADVWVIEIDEVVIDNWFCRKSTKSL